MLERVMFSDDARTRWFGTPWNPSFCDPTYQISVPVGEKCAYCEEVFEPQDYECFLRHICGSVGHLNGWCGCFGGMPEAELDPESMTKRQAAKAAVSIWEKRLGGR